MMHSECGMSSLWRLAQCPGSYAACRGLPDLPRAEALEGTEWHETVARALYAVEVFTELLKRCGKVRARDVLVERPCELYSGGALLTWGICDLAILDRYNLTIHVVDWKFGYLATDPAVLMTQVGGYGEALRQEFPEFSRVIAHVVNPRLRREHSMSIPPGGFLDAIERIISAAHRSTRLAPGDHCRYCRALGLCAATENETREVAALAAPDVSAMPAERIEALLDYVPRVEAAARAVRARAKQLLAADPCALSGWHLSSRRGHRAISVPDALRVVEGVLDAKDVLACCRVKVPDLERAYVARFDAAKEGRAAWRERSEPLITQPVYEELRRATDRSRRTEGIPRGEPAEPDRGGEFAEGSAVDPQGGP